MIFKFDLMSQNVKGAVLSVRKCVLCLSLGGLFKSDKVNLFITYTVFIEGYL
jgi:hypothetical protein